MKCKPLTVGLNVVGNEVLYPAYGSSAVCSPSILQHYIDLGFNLFRVLISWERLQPELASTLSSNSTPSATVNFDSDYLNLIQQFVQICENNQAICLLQINNGGWYDAEYNPDYTNDGTSSCPENGYVYIDQPSTEVNGSTVVGPTTAQFTNMWITLASTSGFAGNPYVRFGLGTKPTLDNSTWTTICNTVISNLRKNNITNVLHLDLQNSDPTEMNDVNLFSDPQDNFVLNINYYDDNNNGDGSSVISTDDYVACAISTNAYWSGINSDEDLKIGFGDVRFDSGSTSITALTKFLNYLRDNISTYEFVCLYGIGGGSNLPSCYTLNYLIVSGNFVDQPQITLAESYTSKYSTSGIYSALSVNLSSNPITYSPTSPYGNQYQSLNTGQLFLPFSPFPDGIKTLTMECWFQQPKTQSTTSGFLFGCSDTFGVVINSTNIEFFYGNDSVVQFEIDNDYQDLNWHHFELGFSDAGVYCFVDGSLIGFSILKQSFDLNPTHGTILGIRSDGKTIGSNNVAILGNIAGFAIWNELRHTKSFSTPTDYYTGMENNIVANFPLNGNIECEM